MDTKTTDPNLIDFPKKFDLSNKTFVVTGACGLIGRAFCEAIAQHSGHVVLADVRESDPMALAEKLSEKHDRKMLGMPVDVGNRDSVDDLLKDTLACFGKVDGLVNGHQNKTKSFFTPFEHYSDEQWDAVVETNLKGTFLTCQILGTWMAENGGGSIVNLASTYSVVAPNQNLYKGTSIGCPAAYSASKGGVMALSKYLATYWAKKKVRVNEIIPHGVWNNHEATFEKNFSELSPMGRMSMNHEVAGALIFLLSDASSYVTGHDLCVEGGWTAW